MAAPMKLAGKTVLFVCFGNTCRSPMAESILCQMLDERGVLPEWRVDSAGVADVFVGSQANPRTNRQLEKNGFRTNQGTSRQITLDDYRDFYYIFGFDESNLKELVERKPPTSTSLIRLLGELDPEKDRIIPDPHNSGDEAFKKVFEQCKRCLEVFLKEVLEECNGVV